MMKACWLQFIILKKICGIKPGQDQVTWPDLLHRHTSTLERFQEWSVAWTWSRIWGWHWNRCRPRSSDDFESHRPPSTPAPTTPALPTPLRPPPLRPPAVPAPYHTGPLRYRPPTEAILCEYSDCMYTQLLKLRYWSSSPVKMIHVQYPKVNSITKKYFMEMNDRLQNLSILLHFRKIKYIDSKESWWTILYLIVWYEPLSCRWHSYAWPK